MIVEITTLEQYRRYLGITYPVLNKFISQATYRNIVTGKIFPSEKNLDKMEELFEISKEEIKKLLPFQKKV